MYLPRLLEQAVQSDLSFFQVTAIIGPRQSGKSTLAQFLMNQREQSLYLDLELPSDRAKLDDPEIFLQEQRGRLICIDEIQRAPELFPLLRSLVDQWKLAGSFLILGSASQDLLKQSSESLAGRISYNVLRPFLPCEMPKSANLGGFLAGGGFPRSFLAKDSEQSLRWRISFIASFLERDLLQWSGATSETMRRLWTMLAHLNGQTANYSQLAGSLGVSDKTVRSYIDLLASTFMVEVVPPHHSNTGKRLIKAPKVYIADSGITCALLSISSYQELVGHPALGAIWEQVVLASIKGIFPEAQVSFYRSSGGAEIDFVVQHAGSLFAVECKASLSPKLSRGNHSALADICPDWSFIVCPVEDSWLVSNNCSVVSLQELIAKMKNF
ncbi:MAG: ATP-binding protein [Coriobacteriia bacterium]|nr:ATP-binding protein [Coriobacteriia bacterium]